MLVQPTSQGRARLQLLLCLWMLAVMSAACHLARIDSLVATDRGHEDSKQTVAINPCYAAPAHQLAL